VTQDPQETAEGCYVDGVLDDSIPKGQCKQKENGAPTKWVEDISFLQDLTTAQSVMDDETNFTAGVIGGYNFQHGRIVFGVEADMGQANEMNSMDSSSFSSVDADQDALDYIASINDPDGDPKTPDGLPPGQELTAVEFGLTENSPTSILTSANADMGLSSFGTIRGRLGGTFHDDRVMAFVTGGVAFGKISTKGSVTYSGTLDDGITKDDPTPDDSFSETRNFGDEGWEVGWTAGAGINYLMGERAILGLTYLYTDLGTHKVNDSFSLSDDGTAAWGAPGDYSSVSGSVKGEVDARFHSLRASFTVLFN
jgi:opacity protein-like surface antigen